MFPSRSPFPATVLALASGAVLGILPPILETVRTSAVHVAHLVLAAGWSWAALAFFVGLARKSRLEAAILAPASLIVGVIAYYVTKLEQGQYLQAVNIADRSQGVQVDWTGFISKTMFWGVAAIVLGLILGLAGNLARNRGFRGLLFQMVIPVVAVVETSMRLHAEASLQGQLAAATWNVTRLVAVAAIVALVAYAVSVCRHQLSPRGSEDNAS